MQVWIVEGHVDYEPGEVLGVVETEEGAKALIERVQEKNERTFDNFSYTCWEVTG